MAFQWARPIFLLLLLAGCAAKPLAELAYIDSPSQLTGKELDTYAFPRTHIDLVPDEKAVAAAIARNVSYEPFRIAVREKSAIGVRTNLNLTKRANTDLLSQAGVEVIDHRAKLAADVGGILKGLVTLGSGLAIRSGAANLPLTLDTLALMPAGPLATSADAANMASWGYDQEVAYWFGPISPDSRPLTPGDVARTSNGLLFAACRELRLSFTVQKGSQAHLVRQTVFASDPRFYRFVAFPRKGTISFHDQCGVSVSTQRDDPAGADAAALLAVINQLNDLEEKLDALEKP